MRLDKYLSNATDYSRTQIKRLIKKGEVAVDGETATNPAANVDDNSHIILQGMPIVAPGGRYFMLHKPDGVVSATKDSDHPTALDLLFDEVRPDQLQIAGRLDIDATGLLLLTDDGQWNHALTSPRSDCKKTYLVTLKAPLTGDLIEKFQEGIWLEREKRRCLPAELEILGDHAARLTISEGKYHQVKRMFGAMDNRVIGLHREKIGDIMLDSELEPGEYRPLTDEEIASVPRRD